MQGDRTMMGWRPHIESALCLNLNELFKKGALRPDTQKAGGWQWSRDGERVASVSYTATVGTESGELRLSYNWTPNDTPQQVTCLVRLSSIPLQYGGRRWYMHCPYTQRRVLKLYKFGGIEMFCSRTAIRPQPTYASQRTSGYNRIVDQRWAIRKKLGDNFSDLFGEPFKPKGMHWRTFQRYADRDAELEDRESGHLRSFIGRLLRE